MKRNNSVIVVLGVLVVLVLGGVAIATMHGTKNSDSTMAGMQMNSSATATNQVSISNYMFSPMDIKVKVGTKVTWTNQDDVHHTITADKGTMPNSPEIGKGESYSYTFNKAGTFTYHCMPHPYMKGTVTVTD